MNAAITPFFALPHQTPPPPPFFVGVKFLFEISIFSFCRDYNVTPHVCMEIYQK